MSADTNIDIVEEKIIQYVNDNPGCSKSDVVRALKDEHVASRLTTLAHIDKLEIKGIVTSKLERPNSQIYKIYVNKDSKFVSVLTELEEFKVAYIGLLERSKDIINNRKYETGTNISELVSYPIHLFYLVIDLVFIRSMILWPEQVDNNEELLKLYSVSYDKITQIQLSLSEFIKSV